MAAINQWGKRSPEDTPVAEPAAQRRRLEDNPSSAHPSMKSRSSMASPFDAMPGEVVQHLFRQADDRTQAALAQCSKTFANNVQRVRWDKAGSLVENGELRITLPLEYEIHSLRTSENQKLAAPTWRLQNQLRLTERKKTFASDREIGFWLGCRHPHMWLGKEATPQLLAGLGSASGWRSLVLAIDRRRVDLATLLRPLIDELGAGYSSAPRELFIQIEGHWEESPLVVPDALWNGRLQLVGLALYDFEKLQPILTQFKQAAALQYLCVGSSDEETTADVLKLINPHFPQLRGLRLSSNETSWVQQKNTLADFRHTHPCLMNFSIEFDESDPSEFSAEFSEMSVRSFLLRKGWFFDTESKFSDWITKTQFLEELRIEICHLSANEGQDFRRLAKAIGVNQSLRKFAIETFGSSYFENFDDKETQYEQCLIDLLEGISCNTHLKEFIFDLDLENFIESEHASKQRVLKYLESLESANPEISVEFHNGFVHVKVGANIMENSEAIFITANEFIASFGWGYAERAAGPEEQVKFQVAMPTWGNGAFKKYLDYLGMDYEQRRKYILDSLSDGSLPVENIQMLPVASTQEWLEQLGIDAGHQ